MTAAAQTKPAKTLNNPLEGSIGIKIFTAIIITGTVVAFLECSEDISWPLPPRTIVLHIYIIAAAIGWYAFASSKSRQSFFDETLRCYLLCSPIAAMVLTQSPVLFWIALGITVIWGVIESLNADRFGQSDWEKALLGVYTAWIVASSVITLGSTSFLPYSRSALALSDIHLILDARILLTALLFLLLLGDSMVTAFNEGMPDIRALPDIRISEITSGYDPLILSILQPVVVILNVILLVIHKVTNVVWHLIALLAVYLYRTGVNLAGHTIDLLSKTRIWLSILRVIISFSVMVLFTTMVMAFSPDIVEYIRSNTSLFSISAHNFWTFLVAIVLFALTLATIVMLCALRGVRDKGLNQASFGGAMILVASWLSGVLMYILSYTQLFKIPGFASIGLYSLLLVLFVGSVFLFQVAKRVTA
jgi:hypothetical protein